MACRKSELCVGSLKGMALQSGVIQVHAAQSKVYRKNLSSGAELLLILLAVLGLLLLTFRHAAASWLDVSWPLGAIFIYRAAVITLGLEFVLMLSLLSIHVRALPSICFIAWVTFCALVKVENDYRLAGLETGLIASVVIISLSRIDYFLRFVRFIPALICVFSLISALLILNYELQNGGLINRLGFRINLELLNNGVDNLNDGLIVNPNEIAMPIALSATALFSQDLRAKGWAIRWVRVFLVAFSIIILVLTQSRGMLIAFALGIFAASMFGAWRWVWHVFTPLLIVGLVVCMVSGLDPFSLNLFSRFGEQDTTLLTIGDRLEIWEAAIERCIDEPIFGQSGVISNTRQIQSSPHNALIGSAELAGVIGTFLLLWIYFQPLLVSARYGLASIGTIVSLIVASMSMDTLPQPIFWIIYACFVVEINRAGSGSHRFSQ